MEVGTTESQYVIQQGTVPGGTTVTIIHDPSQDGLQGNQGHLTVQTLGNLDEPGVAEALLNIAQSNNLITTEDPDMIAAGLPVAHQLAVVKVNDDVVQQTENPEELVENGVAGDEDLPLLETGEGEEIEEGEEVEDGEEVEEGEEEEDTGDQEEQLQADKQKMVEDIHSQMKELCNQLSDLGEESFLVTVRVADASADHLGSIKGDHFVLLRQEMLQDFSDFCLGIEDDEKEDVDDSMFHVDNHEDTVEEEVDNLSDDKDAVEDDSSMEVDETPVKTPPVKLGRNSVPKVIVMRKPNTGPKGKTGDHQYTMQTRRKGAANDSSVTNSVSSQDNRDTHKTNILFLCDVCKNVFSDLKELKEHKLQAHDESDYPCKSCSRVFTVKKNLERHELDAHSSEGLERFICDTCVMDFTSKEELESHNNAAHDPDQPMKCDVCEQTFPDITLMMDHRKCHFDYDCFCTKCWQGFFDFLELETHIQTNCRYKEALYKCDICGKKYTKLHAINKHIDTHPIHAPHVCRMCGRGFESEKDLKMHKTAAHIVRPYKCEFCEKTFKKKESLVEHRRIHLKVQMFAPVAGSVSDQRYVCSICGIVLHSANTLEQHMQRHDDGSEEHPCDMCDKRFFSRSLLIVHCRKEHKVFINMNKGMESNDMVACEWPGCDKTFLDRTKWKYHMKYHRDRADKIARGISVTPKPEAVDCPLCGKTLKYKSYLKLHMQSHTGERPHQCDICGNSYATQRRLNDHIRVHKGEKPFKCRVCDKSFTSTSLRQQHMVVHWGSKTYICDVCGKGFMSRKHFHDHMRIHAGEQPHKCEVCGKDFIYYRSLVRHALTHIDPKERPKPYKCHYCGKEYTEVTGYKHHLRSIHTGETPFQCDICGESFHRNDKLKRHMKSRHNKSDKASSVRTQTHIVTTRRTTPHGAPIIIKTEEEREEDGVMQIVQGMPEMSEEQNELHVDVIQENQPQVLLIGVGVPGEEGDTTYVQETQVIEGPDGVRYIIAGTGEELQVIESSDIQQFEDGSIIQAGEHLVSSDQQVTFAADQETLATLASMASVAEVADVQQQVM